MRPLRIFCAQLELGAPHQEVAMVEAIIDAFLSNCLLVMILFVTVGDRWIVAVTQLLQAISSETREWFKQLKDEKK